MFYTYQSQSTDIHFNWTIWFMANTCSRQNQVHIIHHHHHHHGHFSLTKKSEVATEMNCNSTSSSVRVTTELHEKHAHAYLVIAVFAIGSVDTRVFCTEQTEFFATITDIYFNLLWRCNSEQVLWYLFGRDRRTWVEFWTFSIARFA